jgi:pimeloyl-ACP methyl ester carboxylesterase
MNNKPNLHLIFIHGLISSGQSYKANLLRGFFPDILTPDFEGSLEDEGSLEERLAQLEPILSDRSDWIIIGSSFGGLMGAMFTRQHPAQVSKLILLAPALIWPEFDQVLPPPVSVPTVVYHGINDELIPLDLVRPLAEGVFTDLVQGIDWRALVGEG